MSQALLIADWTACNAKCGSKGHNYRILACLDAIGNFLSYDTCTNADYFASSPYWDVESSQVRQSLAFVVAHFVWSRAMACTVFTPRRGHVNSRRHPRARVYSLSAVRTHATHSHTFVFQKPRSGARRCTHTQTDDGGGLV